MIASLKSRYHHSDREYPRSPSVRPAMFTVIGHAVALNARGVQFLPRVVVFDTIFKRH